MHNATQSKTTITTHCTTSTELLLSGTDDSSVTRRTSFKLQQCCHYFVSNPCTQQLNIKHKNNIDILTNTLHHYSVSMIIIAYNNTAPIILSQQIQTQNFLCLNVINVLTCIRNSKLLGVPYQLKHSPKPQASQPQKTIQ